MCLLAEKVTGFSELCKNIWMVYTHKWFSQAMMGRLVLVDHEVPKVQLKFSCIFSSFASLARTWAHNTLRIIPCIIWLRERFFGFGGFFCFVLGFFWFHWYFFQWLCISCM